MYQGRLSRFRTLDLVSAMRGKLGTVLVITLTPLIFFWPAVVGQNLLAIGDGWSYSLLMKALCGRLIAQGVFP